MIKVLADHAQRSYLDVLSVLKTNVLNVSILTFFLLLANVITSYLSNLKTPTVLKQRIENVSNARRIDSVH